MKLTPKISKNQEGFVHHLGLIVLGVVVLSGIGFAGWRVWSNRIDAGASSEIVYSMKTKTVDASIKACKLDNDGAVRVRFLRGSSKSGFTAGSATTQVPDEKDKKKTTAFTVLTDEWNEDQRAIIVNFNTLPTRKFDVNFVKDPTEISTTEFNGKTNINANKLPICKVKDDNFNWTVRDLDKKHPATLKMCKTNAKIKGEKSLIVNYILEHKVTSLDDTTSAGHDQSVSMQLRNVRAIASTPTAQVVSKEKRTVKKGESRSAHLVASMEAIKFGGKSDAKDSTPDRWAIVTTTTDKNGKVIATDGGENLKNFSKNLSYDDIVVCEK
jgi:hypothetical protein